MPAPTFSRRAVLRAGALGAAAAGLSLVVAEADVSHQSPPGVRSLDGDWLFGGVYATGAERVGYSEAGFAAVTLPHVVTPLSWSDWRPGSWERRYIYRRHLSHRELSGGRAFVDFQGVMTTATVWCNGRLLATHVGGYLPFSVELTDHVVAGDNVLAVRVDATPQDVPPADVARGPGAIDYLQPGGLYRDVTLRIVPEVHVADVFAAPVDVLTAPALETLVTLDCGRRRTGSLTVTVQLSRGAHRVAEASARVPAAGRWAQARLRLGDLREVSLWSPESPALYGVRVTVADGDSAHAFDTRTGFREAVFDTGGLRLNGDRYEIFGLNRHQLYPYLGMAAGPRLQRRDAEILKHELSCNMVRCSHYPQSGHFLDACDELGLMVWQETPGWQHVGGSAFRALVRQNVEDMVLRDRSRPSVIVWGTRLNETANHPDFYRQTARIADALDGTRQSTGAMDIHSLRDWNEQVFAYDDYRSVGGDNRDADLRPPLPGVPYLVSEAVGAVTGAPRYRWIDSQATLALQGRLHAQVHSQARSRPGYAGLLGWSGFDYQSLNGRKRIWRATKTTGVADVFRVLKPAAGLYASQAAAAPMIAPAFFWDFGPASPATGPGAGTIVFTNCDRIELYVGAATDPTASGAPDHRAFPGLAHPPVVLDVPALDGAGHPPLRIDGLIGGRVACTLRMSSDPAGDGLVLALDDDAIQADGSDATRFTLRIADAHGNHRPVGPASGLQATLALAGPATLIADNPFPIGANGGVAGGFIRSLAGRVGTVTLSAACPGYEPRSVALATRRGTIAAAPRGAGAPRVLTAPPSPAAPPVSAIDAHPSARPV